MKIVVKRDEEGNVKEIVVKEEEKIIEVLRNKYNIHNAKTFLECFLDSFEEGSLTVFEEEWLRANKDATKFLESLVIEK